nr:hypothetical protein Iba_chr10dCG11860 [Ipomoea batatas]
MGIITRALWAYDDRSLNCSDRTSYLLGWSSSIWPLAALLGLSFDEALLRQQQSQVRREREETAATGSVANRVKGRPPEVLPVLGRICRRRRSRFRLMLFLLQFRFQWEFKQDALRLYGNLVQIEKVQKVFVVLMITLAFYFKSIIYMILL